MTKAKSYMSADTPSWWRDIPGYGGKYQVSRIGEVRRVFDSGLVRDMTPYHKKRKILKRNLFVKLTKEHKAKEVPLLSIIVSAWYGAPPDDKVAYHINGNITDNRLENIGFIDRKTLGEKTGGTTSRRKTVFKVDKDGNEIEVYRSAHEAAKANFMSYQTVLDRCHGKIKKPYELNGYTFRFEEKAGRRNNKYDEQEHPAEVQNE